MKRIYAQGIADAISSYLDATNIDYTFDEEKGKFTFNYYQLKLIINVNEDDFFTYTYTKLKPSEQTLSLVYKYMQRIGSAESLANFTYDEEGYLVCRCYTNCFDYIPPQEMIEDSILSVANRMDSYCDVFSIIANEDAPSDEVLEQLATFEFRRVV